MSEEEQLVFVFIPSLVSLLLRAERDKGAPLLESEVLAIRDGATCVATPADGARAVQDERGYEDIDPERCWAAWSAARTSLLSD